MTPPPVIPPPIIIIPPWWMGNLIMWPKNFTWPNPKKEKELNIDKGIFCRIGYIEQSEIKYLVYPRLNGSICVKYIKRLKSRKMTCCVNQFIDISIPLKEIIPCQIIGRV